jgi:predicted lysophospholipase L1 biosynthesis ABC-type transport system permease subunit
MLIGTVVKTLVLIVLILTLLAMISDDLLASETQSVANPGPQKYISHQPRPGVFGEEASSL